MQGRVLGDHIRGHTCRLCGDATPGLERGDEFGGCIVGDRWCGGLACRPRPCRGRLGQHVDGVADVAAATMRFGVLLVAEVAQQRQAPTLCASRERLGGVEAIPTTTGDAPSALTHLISAIRTESTKAHPTTPELAGAGVELDGADRFG